MDNRLLYFQWLKDCIGFPPNNKEYFRMLMYLYSKNFTYLIPMDSNRAEDGIGLRYRYMKHKGAYDVFEDYEFYSSPCSVLEMMVALSLRCDEEIMGDVDAGLNVGRWFWPMIDNLGLSEMTDDFYDEDYVIFVIDRFLNRQYNSNGLGGLFVTNHFDVDMRSVEIWYQLQWWLQEEAQ